MNKVKLFYPVGIESIWHHSADGDREYRLDGIEKLVRLRNDLQQDPVFEIVEVRDAPLDLLRAVHTSEYLKALEYGEPRELAGSSGLLWQPNLMQAFANSAESLILATKEALGDGQTGVISKGGHHAVASRGFGFNPINEIAICVTKLQLENPGLRIVVIDLDVHLGNGLHQLLADRQNTLLVDIWSKTNDKWGAPVNAANIVSIKVESKDEYWVNLEKIITKAKEFTPDLVIYHSGMDIFSEDRLGGIPGFSEGDVQIREGKVIRAFPHGLVLVPGGGYVDHSTPERSKYGMQKLVELHMKSFMQLKPQ